LEVSAPGSLLVLTRSHDGHAATIARSYDGHAWEGVGSLFDLPAPLKFDCETTAGPSPARCRAALANESGTTYAVEARLAEALPLKAQASRFLSQATFGPKMSEVEGLLGAAATDNELRAAEGAWIESQMALPPTLHRAHYRARVNLRYERDSKFVASVQEPCVNGSRWHRFALSEADEGKMLEVTATLVAGVRMLELKVQGVRRALCDPADSEGCITRLGSYWLCSVEERVGGAVTFDEWPSCTDPINPKSRPKDEGTYSGANPPISSPKPELTQSFAPDEATLTPLPFAADAVLLSVSVACTVTAEQGATFMSYGGKHYMLDRRLRLMRNTLSAPAEAAVDADTCPVAERTFLNEGSCERRRTCAPMVFPPTQVTLDEALLREWWLRSNKPIYYVLGLAFEPPYDAGWAGASPCGKSVSRWSSWPFPR